VIAAREAVAASRAQAVARSWSRCGGDRNAGRKRRRSRASLRFRARTKGGPGANPGRSYQTDVSWPAICAGRARPCHRPTRQRSRPGGGGDLAVKRRSAYRDLAPERSRAVSCRGPGTGPGTAPRLRTRAQLILAKLALRPRCQPRRLRVAHRCAAAQRGLHRAASAPPASRTDDARSPARARTRRRAGKEPGSRQRGGQGKVGRKGAEDGGGRRRTELAARRGAGGGGGAASGKKAHPPRDDRLGRAAGLIGDRQEGALQRQRHQGSGTWTAARDGDRLCDGCGRGATPACVQVPRKAPQLTATATRRFVTETGALRYKGLNRAQAR